MKVNGWLLRKFKNINRERMKKTIDIIAKESGKSKLFIIFDMMLNFIARGSGYTDYFRGNYINLEKKEKDTFFTAKTFYIFLSYMNNSQFKEILNDKLTFNKYFNKYIMREWHDIRTLSYEDFERFTNRHSIFFAKLPSGEGGHGVERIVVKDWNIEKLYNSINENHQYLIEEAIIQNDELNEINPNVVNSFRIVTLYKDGKVYVLNNALRVNQDNSSVIGCTNDLYFCLNENGKIDSNVIDDYGNIYTEHPLTHKRFDEVHISNVTEAFELAKRMHMELPEMRYIGWDIAFTKNGVDVIEGNEYPGYGLLQFYKLYPQKRYGHLKEVRDVIGEEEYKKLGILI